MKLTKACLHRHGAPIYICIYSYENTLRLIKCTDFLILHRQCKLIVEDFSAVTYLVFDGFSEFFIKHFQHFQSINRISLTFTLLSSIKISAYVYWLWIGSRQENALRSCSQSCVKSRESQKTLVYAMCPREYCLFLSANFALRLNGLNAQNPLCFERQCS